MLASQGSLMRACGGGRASGGGRPRSPLCGLAAECRWPLFLRLLYLLERRGKTILCPIYGDPEVSGEDEAPVRAAVPAPRAPAPQPV